MAECVKFDRPAAFLGSQYPPIGPYMFESLQNAIVDHWLEAVVGFVFMAVGLIIGRWRASKKFRKREFFERLNVSLNSIVDGTLCIRTLMEKNSQDVFLNTVAVSRLLDAAKKTTEDDPIIPFDTDDYWFYLNSVLNEISEQFAGGFILRDAGAEVKRVHYVICLTNECDGNLQTRKIRAMVVQKSLLENLPQDPPEFEQPYHDTRWNTLKLMAQRWRENAIQFKEIEVLA